MDLFLEDLRDFLQKDPDKATGRLLQGILQRCVFFFGYIANRDSLKLTASLALKFMDGWFRRSGFLLKWSLFIPCEFWEGTGKTLYTRPPSASIDFINQKSVCHSAILMVILQKWDQLEAYCSRKLNNLKVVSQSL